MPKFYLTTPLYYVNDKPHLGTAYATIMTDTLHRYHELFGDEVLFLTGTDEHGQKCQQAAEKRGMTPQAHCDDMVKNYQNAWRELNIGYELPADWVAKMPGAKTMRASISGRNLAIISPYNGFDPEVNNGGNQVARFVDLAPFPPSRSVDFKLSVGF